MLEGTHSGRYIRQRVHTMEIKYGGGYIRWRIHMVEGTHYVHMVEVHIIEYIHGGEYIQ